MPTSDVMTTDVLVVGAGPAGCAAAYDLAAAGHDVCLVDRRSFPRVKPCAGALTAKTIRALRFPITPVVRQITTNLVTGRGRGEQTVRRGRRVLAAMTVRAELDHYVLEKTVEAGARFETIGAVRAIRQLEDHVVLQTRTDEIRCRYLVGADGANSVVRVLTAEFPDIRWGFALECQMPGGGSTRDLALDFGVVPSGYGWVFPKGDHVNVGIYTSDATIPLRPDDLRAYARARVGGDVLTHLVGQRVGLGGWGYRPRSQRVFLVGDAAGLTEPVLGEGIYYAVKSGQAAAEAIVAERSGQAGARDLFRARIRVLARDVACARRVADRFYADLGVGHRTLTVPLVSYWVMKGCAAGMTIREGLRSCYTVPFRRVPPLPGIRASNPAGLDRSLSAQPRQRVRGCD